MTERFDELLTTAEAAERTGLSIATIKRWADAGVISCRRTAGGHRRFVASELDAMSAKLLGPTPAPGRPLDAEEAERLALAGDARSLFERAHAWMQLRADLPTLFDLVFAPALAHVGERWARAQLSVADEHTATAAFAETIDRLAAFVDRPPVRGPAISACVDGERHEIPTRMVGLVLRAAGFHPLTPGADTPTNALLEFLDRTAPRVVCLSATHLPFTPDFQANLRRIADASAARRVRLVVGGRAFTALPGLPAGVHFAADMRQLVALLEQPHA